MIVVVVQSLNYHEACIVAGEEEKCWLTEHWQDCVKVGVVLHQCCMTVVKLTGQWKESVVAAY